MNKMKKKREDMSVLPKKNLPYPHVPSRVDKEL